MSHVLVAYATGRDSTRHIAEGIAFALEADGAHVRVTPASSAPETVLRWDLVVLGAPLVFARWHSDAHRFLARHRRELARAAVAVFGTGPQPGNDERWQRARIQLDRALARYPWLTPMAVGLFSGVEPAGRHTRSGPGVHDLTDVDIWARKLHALVQPI